MQGAMIRGGIKYEDEVAAFGSIGCPRHHT
jgi:hypothetical protein